MQLYTMISLLFLTATIQASAAGPDGTKGILPGEPDPNTAPGKELVDDRHRCPPGTKRYQRMRCVAADELEPECANYAPVLECMKKPPRVKCAPPKVLKGDFKCIPDGR